MSRGLGKLQRLMLGALKAIEAERGSRCDNLWAVSYIVEKAFELSAELQDIERQRIEAHKAHTERIKAMSLNGNQLAMEYLKLDRLLPGRSYSGRKERECPGWVETHLNTSRVLALLERRGLVTRQGGRGASFVALTDAGRSIK